MPTNHAVPDQTYWGQLTELADGATHANMSSCETKSHRHEAVCTRRTLPSRKPTQQEPIASEMLLLGISLQLLSEKVTHEHKGNPDAIPISPLGKSRFWRPACVKKKRLARLYGFQGSDVAVSCPRARCQFSTATASPTASTAGGAGLGSGRCALRELRVGCSARCTESLFPDPMMGIGKGYTAQGPPTTTSCMNGPLSFTCGP